MNKRPQSTVVVKKGSTVSEAAQKVLRRVSEPLGPAEIAEIGLKRGIFRIPRFRTRSFLTQRIQSTLHNDAEYSVDPTFYRPRKGVYSLL